MNIDFGNIEIENFRSLETFSLDFTPGVTIIRGPNGAGKSSIFNAVYAAITNRLVNGRPTNKAITQGKKNSHLKLYLSVNGVNYIITRDIGNPSGLQLEYEGKIIKGTSAKKILDELIPADILKLYMLEDISLRDMLAKFIDIQSFQENIKSKITDLQNKIDTLEQDKLVYSQQITNQEFKVSSTEKMIEEKTTKLETVKNNINNISEHIKDVNQENIRAFKTEFKARLDSISKELNQELQEQYFVPKANIEKNITNIQLQLSKLVNNLQDKIRHKENAVSTKVNELNSKLTILRNDINNYQKLMKQGKCFVCKRDIKEQDINYYKNILKTLQEQYKEIEIEINSLVKDKQTYTDLVSQQIQEYQSQAQNKLNEISQKLKELEDIKENITSNYNSQNKLEEIKQELLEKYHLDESMINIDLEIFNQYNSLLQEQQLLEEDIKSLHNQLTSQRKELEDLINKYKNTNIETKQKELNETLKKIDIWTDTRLLKKLLLKTVSQSLNIILQKQKLNQIRLELDDKDNILVIGKNNRDQDILLEDVSTGEGVILKLQMYLALIELFSNNTKLNILFLDEVLDSLDEVNQERVVSFLKEFSHKNNICTYVITHKTTLEVPDYALTLDL